MRIRERREALGLTQVELARRANIPQTSISHYEVGDREMGSTALLGLARALECSADYLLGLTDDPTSRNLPPGLTPDEQAVIEALRANDLLGAIRRIVREV